jgi:cytochrome o ubiquinol oxidase subunit IV
MNSDTHHATSHQIGHGDAHGSVKSYTVGIILSLLLTFGSFGAVMTDMVPKDLGLTAIVVLCVAQLIVQLVCFLHIGAARAQRSNVVVLFFTAFLTVVIVGLSLWVMHNANVNMMPMHMSVQGAMSHE